MERLVLSIIVVLCVYTIIPTFVIRLFGFGAYKKSSFSRGIALTFDDGPDPQYTPRLLDILKRHRVRATFFVLGSKAEQYPDLIARMHAEGHLVGIHNYVHWANALMTPKRVRAELNHSVEAIERIIGEKPVYYRPPWGVINLFDFLLLKRFRLVLWSVIVGDWRSRGGKTKIKRRLLSRLKEGAVIVLHDSGQTFGADSDAPTHMLGALEEFLIEALDKGYLFLRVDERPANERNDSIRLSLKKRLLVYLWLKWDALFCVLFGVKPVNSEHPFLLYRVRPYKGRTICLSGGEQIASGDSVIELHFNNHMLVGMLKNCRSLVHLAVLIIRSVQQALPQVSAKIATDPDCIAVKGIYGITMIHRGADQLGFTLISLPGGWFSRLTSMYLRALLYAFHPEGGNRLKVNTAALTPKVLAISAQELKKRYSPPELAGP